MIFTPRCIAQRIALTLIASVLIACAAPADAQQTRARLNYEYRAIDPQPVATGNRIEVIEFFWYGCPYCNALQPSLANWARRKPADVDLRHVPAVFRASWIPHARIFYTLESLGELERLHQEVYRSIHVGRESLSSPDSSAEWANRNGIERARWIAAYDSPQVERKVDQAVAATRAYMLEGTPSLVVDGRYLTSTGMSETIEGVITILDDLVAMARERRAGK